MQGVLIKHLFYSIIAGNANNAPYPDQIKQGVLCWLSNRNHTKQGIEKQPCIFQRKYFIMGQSVSKMQKSLWETIHSGLHLPTYSNQRYIDFISLCKITQARLPLSMYRATERIVVQWKYKQVARNSKLS